MEFIDQMGNSLELNETPKRIISLVPSQTELLYYLGVEPIAQTLFCIHPKDKFRSSVKIGGTKKLNLDKIRSLQPDLIIGNKEENTREQIEELQADFPVWMSDVNSLKDAYDMIVRLGVVVGKSQEAVNLKLTIEHRFNRLITSKSNRQRVLYLIWNDPMFGVGNHTFIHDVISSAGYYNVLENEERYPELTDEIIKHHSPDIIFLSSEPFPFKIEHRMQFEKRFRTSEVQLVDGEMFSWYGNRLLQTPDYLAALKNSL
jgi:ABC-type Fe3+-hydroxamate transport system substrate-binding protein